MNVKLIRYTPDPDGLCGLAAALCYDSNSPIKALRRALENGHESVAEHASFSFLVEDVSRVLLAQLTRHRIAAYSVRSQRYCGADLTHVTPDSLCREDLVGDLVELDKLVEKTYEKALSLGVPAEDARYFTLQGGTTKLLFTMNARELRHFLSLRCCNRAQWEIQRMADLVLKEARAVAPELFKNAGCACMQGLPCPEGKMSCGNPREKV